MTRNFIPGAVGLTLAMLSLAMAPTGASAVAASSVPACDAIALHTAMKNDRWRVMTGPADPTDQVPVYACRRGSRAPAALLEIGGARAALGYQYPIMLVGSRLLVQGSDGPSSAGSGGEKTVVDLPTRKTLPLGFEGSSITPSYTRRPVVLTAGGGIATATWSAEGRGGSFGDDAALDGPLQLWNGSSLVPGTPQVRAIARATPGTTGGPDAYLVTTEGVKRVAPPAVPTSAFSGSRIRYLKTTRQPRIVARAGVKRTPLGTGGTGGWEFSLVVERRRKQASARAWIEARGCCGSTEKTVYPLAAGGQRDVRVLASSAEGGLVVAARFAGADGSLRLRALAPRLAFTTSIDLPATPTTLLPGRVALSIRALAIADADHVKIFRSRPGQGAAVAQATPELTTEAIRGAHDLTTISDVTSNAVDPTPTLLFTNEAGQPGALAVPDLPQLR